MTEKTTKQTLIEQAQEAAKALFVSVAYEDENKEETLYWKLADRIEELEEALVDIANHPSSPNFLISHANKALQGE